MNQTGRSAKVDGPKEKTERFEVMNLDGLEGLKWTVCRDQMSK